MITNFGFDSGSAGVFVGDSSNTLAQADPTGTFYVYAGQYQPEAASSLRKLDPPTYVAVMDKPWSYETVDGNMNVAVRLESINQVDEPTRDQWIVGTATRTIERLQAFDEETNNYAQMAHEEYGGSISLYREEAIAVLESLDEPDEPAGETENGE